MEAESQLVERITEYRLFELPMMIHKYRAAQRRSRPIPADNTK